MVYVGLSRVQALTQLYILAKSDNLPVDKIVPWADAMEEMGRLEKLDLSKPIPVISNEFEIVSLNIISLRTHYEDIKVDPNLMSAKVLLLQETSLPDDFQCSNRFNLEGKMSHFNSRGHRKGLAINSFWKKTISRQELIHHSPVILKVDVWIRYISVFLIIHFTMTHLLKYVYIVTMNLWIGN